MVDLPHLACAAFCAISLRFLADSFAALALPPFSPPSLPNSTAAGFFCGLSSCGCSSPVASATIEAARWWVTFTLTRKAPIILACEQKPG